MSQTFLNNLMWRHATKEFDSSKKVPAKDLDKILEAIQYSPSSYGLQSYHVCIVSDEKLKKKLKLAAFLQKQIDSCSHLLVFCARTDKDDMLKRVDDYADLQSKINNTSNIKLQGLKLMMKGSIKKRNDEEHAAWAAKQCYIALGFAMAATAELHIDSCAMEGFDKKTFDKILKLPEHLSSTVLLPIGYRKEEPGRKKVRFTKEDLFTTK